MSAASRIRDGLTPVVGALACMLALSGAAWAASDEPVGRARPLDVYLFASSTCSGCKGIKERLFPRLRERYGDSVNVTHVPVDDVEQFKLQLLYEKRYGVEDDEALKVFVGDTCLSGEKAILGRLEEAVARELQNGSHTPTATEIRAGSDSKVAGEMDAAASADGLAAERFSRFKPLGIALAGLVDGINPCAFTTLIFFVSLLTTLGKQRREVLLVGMCFALAVFGTYLTLGVGALKVIKVVSVTSGISSVLTGGVAAFAMVLGGYSFWDFARYQRGKDAGEVALKLPERIRMRVRTIMSRQMRTRNLVIGALFLGVFVSLLESLCTGQVYLPTILCVTRDPRLACRGFAWLVLYNVMFILPLLGVFALAYCGVTSERMAALSRKHLGWAKLLMAVLFMGLGVALIVTMI